MSGGYMPSHSAPRAEESNSQPETIDLLDIGRAEESNSQPETIDLLNIGSDDTNEHHQHQFSPELSVTTDSSFVGTVSDQQRSRHHHPNKCQLKGCSKGARGASGLCITHGGGQRCKKPGCNKGAESRTAYCKAHGGGRRCQLLGCTKSAEGRTDYCIAHGGGRRCGYPGCTKAARGKSGLCIRHGGGKRCTVERCTRSAKGQAGLCISHGGGRRCQYLGCSKRAQGCTMFCKAHASKQSDEMSGECLTYSQPITVNTVGECATAVAPLSSEAIINLCSNAPVYGRDYEKMRVIELLLSDDHSRDHNVSIVCVAGDCGVGKTTLADLVYSELVAQGIFEARAWVCVNERLDVRGLMKAITESLAGFSCGLTELKEIQEAVREELTGKRFLLVLDNVCNDDPSFWSSLLVPLNVGARGSVVLATSRNEIEVLNMDMMRPYELNRLSESNCWLVLQQHVFDGKSHNCRSELIEIGKQITAKCGGLPLSVKAIGGILQSELNEESWTAVLESGLWFTVKSLPALRLSYDNATVHLQHCVQYCSLFSKGYIFEKDQLVRLWMSQGFIERKEGKYEQDTGSEYFNELLERSFFQHSSITESLETKYVMHDLFHDIAQSMAGNKSLRAETSKLPSIPEAVHHVSLVPAGFDTALQFESFKEPRDNIHTFLLINSSIMKSETNVFHVEDPAILNDLFSHLRFLRTLDLSFTDIDEVPDSIENLQNLCYLALNRTNIRQLPESICNIYNLQTLELRGCNYLAELPAHMKNLTNLQHLEVWKETGFVLMPQGIGQLTGLQTLSTFMVRGDQFGIRELKDLKNLRGALCMGGLSSVVSGEEAKEAKLEMKEHLRTLILQWFNCREDLEDDQSAETASEVLQNLQPHSDLRELTIHNYCGNQFPSWLADPSFSKLISITLENCYECNFLPPLGQLPSLKHLSIRMTDSVQSVGLQFCGFGTSRGFPSLETLKLWEMSELEEWCGVGEEDFPCLRNLSISRCDKLKRLPCFAFLQELSVHYCAQMPELASLPCLKSLKIEGFQNLESLPQQLDLPVLNSLEISNCNQLTSLEGLSHIASLEQLEITRCPKLNFSPNEQLPSMLRVVDVHRGCSLLSNWCPDGFEEIINIHQVRRKLVCFSLPTSSSSNNNNNNLSAATSFRFQPTEVELVSYYLKRKVCGRPLVVDAIAEIDIYKYEPWDLPSHSRLKTSDEMWYFFSPLNRKHSSGYRTNRATNMGYWKSVGKDRAVRYASRVVGMKKTLIFYKGRVPCGERTNWVMHEYRLEDAQPAAAESSHHPPPSTALAIPQDSFVLCRIFQKL